MKMRILISFLFVGIFLTSCHVEKSLVFLGKNAYEDPVWEEMIKKETVNLKDLDAAYEAYASNHQIDESKAKNFIKLKKRFEGSLDVNGNYVSMGLQYEDLMLRRASRNPEMEPQANFDLSQKAFTMGIPNPSGSGSWHCIGPFGNPDIHWTATGNGAMQYLEMHPTNPAIMYACSRNGGLWKTINYGAHWEPITSYFATPHTSCIEVCTANPQILYLGAAEDKMIWYSSDEGVNWVNRSTGLDGEIYDIHSDPTNATRVVASTTTGIYLSTNSGATWTQKVAGQFTDLRVSSTLDLMIITKNVPETSPTKLHFSIDKGETWLQHDLPINNGAADRFHVVMHQPTTGPIKVFAYGLKSGHTPGRFMGLWKSDYNPAGPPYFTFTEVKESTYNYPNGPVVLKWQEAAPGYFPQVGDGYGDVSPFTDNTWASDFWVSNNNPDRMITLTEKFWGSDNGGKIWDFKPSYGGSTWADMRFFTQNVAKDTVYFLNDGGIWSIKEDDLFPTPAVVTASGLSRENYIISKVVTKNGDICVTEGSQMDVSQMNKDVFITGGQDIGQVFSRNGRTTHVASADVYRGRIKPSDDTKFHTAALKVKLNGGTDIYEVYNHIQADNFNANRMYGYTTKNATTNTPIVSLVRSPAGLDGWPVVGFVGENTANSGGSNGWTPVNNNWETVNIASTGITTQKEGTFEQSRALADIGILGDEVGHKVFITNNLSAAVPTWTQLTSAPSSSRYRIATHAFNENIIALATDNGVYLSKDKGVSWSKKGNFPESNPLFILMDKEVGEGIYVMTNQNVCYKDEFKSDWVEFNKALPLMQNQDMRIAYYPDGDSRLYVAKYGRGVWVSPLQSVLDKNGDKPVADFKIHGTSTSELLVGQTVKLIDLSLNAESISWVIENGADVITKGNIKQPTAVLNTPGYYKVTLTATNAQGSSIKIKEYFIHVSAPAQTLTCPLTTDADLDYPRGFNNIKIDADVYTTTSVANYINSGKTYTATLGVPATFFTDDNNPGGNFYTKAWIDYNNDGDFDDAGEEIANSGGPVETMTSSFTPPASAVLNQPLRMRVAGLESATAPTNCQTTGSRQNIDFLIVLKNIVAFTSSSSVLTPNSASMTTTYTGGSTVTKGGFVYSKFDGDLNIENSFVVNHVGALTNAGTYTETLTNLDFNTTYYYRPFVFDAGGIHYGTKMSFTLAQYKIPMAESIIALHTGGTNWRLIGRVLPEGHTLASVAIEHGQTSFTTTTPINISGQNPNTNYDVEIPVTLGSGVTTYQYRVKLVLDGKTYYSEKLVFHPNQTHCTPTVTLSTWFKRFKTVNLISVTHTEPAGDPPYEDATSVVFNLDKGTNPILTITGSEPSWHNLTYKVYIDLNNDNDFDDNQELVGFQAPIASHITPITLTIPSNYIVIGTNLRMRVIGFEGTSNYCNAEVGNIKDFTVYIKPTVVSIKAFMQGPYSGTQMSDNLRTTVPLLIPTLEPYTGLGYTHVNGGGETCNANVFTITGDNAIVDWVYVELRDKNNPTLVKHTRSALIQRDGDIVDVDGISPLSFKLANPDNYYVAVRHRNHLGFRTNVSIALSTTAASLNFTNNSVATFGTNALKQISTGVYGMYSGDANRDGEVNAFDLNAHWKVQNSQLGYLGADFNLDGEVNAFDLNAHWKVNNSIVQQLD